MKNNKENLYDLANEIYFKAIKGKEKQFIIELEDRSTENTEEGSELYDEKRNRSCSNNKRCTR